MPDVFFEDVTLGFCARSPAYVVSEEEIVEFGRRFDPRPFHTDAVAARDSVFGGLVAPGCLIFAIRSALMNSMQPRIMYLAGLGLEAMDLPRPVRPNDKLLLCIECIDRRESRSRPEAGIVHFRNTLTNQRDEIVMTMIAKVMVSKKAGTARPVE